MKQKTAIRLAVILLMGVILVGCGDREPATATVGKEKIGVSETIFYTRLNQQQWEMAYAESFGPDFWSRSLGEEIGTFADELKRQVMETVIQIHVLNAHADEYKIKLTKEEEAQVEARVAEFMESHSESVKEAAGATEELVEILLRQRVIADKVTEAMVADYVPTVTKEEASLGRMIYCLFSTLGTYDAQGNHTTVSEEEKGQIKEEAQAFAARAQELRDLEAAADMDKRTYIDVYFNETTNGGAHEKVAEILRTMEVGQVSEPIETEDGYYVIQYVSEYDEEATNANMENLAQVKTQQYFEDLYDRWCEQTEITVDWTVLDTIPIDKVLFVD